MKNQKSESEKSIIGKQYFPVDNSYAVCLNDGENHYLAGTFNEKPTLITIISEPFLMKPKGRKLTGDLFFILVKTDNDNIHSVIFNEKGLELGSVLENHESNNQDPWF